MLFQDFYKLAAEQFSNANWIRNSLFLPDLHENFSRSKPLPLNVTPITAEQLKKELHDNRYKMVKLVADWERSGAGAGMVSHVDDNDDDDEGDPTEYEFIDGDD